MRKRSPPGDPPDPPSPLLRTSKLVKVYRADGVTVEAVRGVDIELAVGEFVAIMGPSGSGKSTLLHMLGGLEPAQDVQQGRFTRTRRSHDGDELAHGELDVHPPDRLHRDPVGPVDLHQLGGS